MKTEQKETKEEILPLTCGIFESDEMNALFSALEKTAADLGYSGQFPIPEYLEHAPPCSLVAELVNTLHEFGYRITKEKY